MGFTIYRGISVGVEILPSQCDILALQESETETLPVLFTRGHCLYFYAAMVQCGMAHSPQFTQKTHGKCSYDFHHKVGHFYPLATVELLLALCDIQSYCYPSCEAF